MNLDSPAPLPFPVPLPPVCEACGGPVGDCPPGHDDGDTAVCGQCWADVVDGGEHEPELRLVT